jgi:hypothetical protein
MSTILPRPHATPTSWASNRNTLMVKTWKEKRGSTGMGTCTRCVYTCVSSNHGNSTMPFCGDKSLWQVLWLFYVDLHVSELSRTMEVRVRDVNSISDAATRLPAATTYHRRGLLSTLLEMCSRKHRKRLCNIGSCRMVGNRTELRVTPGESQHSTSMQEMQGM